MASTNQAGWITWKPVSRKSRERPGIDMSMLILTLRSLPPVHRSILGHGRAWGDGPRQARTGNAAGTTRHGLIRLLDYLDLGTTLITKERGTAIRESPTLRCSPEGGSVAHDLALTSSPKIRHEAAQATLKGRGNCCLVESYINVERIIYLVKRETDREHSERHSNLTSVENRNGLPDYQCC